MTLKTNKIITNLYKRDKDSLNNLMIHRIKMS